MNIEILDSKVGDFIIFVVNGKTRMCRTEKEMQDIIRKEEKEALDLANPVIQEAKKAAHKAYEIVKSEKRKESKDLATIAETGFMTKKDSYVTEVENPCELGKIERRNRREEKKINVEMINSKPGIFVIFKLNGKSMMTRTLEEMQVIIDKAEERQRLSFMDKGMNEFIQHAEKACVPSKIQREKEVKIYRKKYSLTPHGKYIRSLSNSTRRKRYVTDFFGLTKEEKFKIGEFYKNCPEGYEVDHIIPVSKGGKHILENLQYLTRNENRRKSAKLNFKDYDVYEKNTQIITNSELKPKFDRSTTCLKRV